MRITLHNFFLKIMNYPDFEVNHCLTGYRKIWRSWLIIGSVFYIEKVKGSHKIVYYNLIFSVFKFSSSPLL